MPERTKAGCRILKAHTADRVRSDRDTDTDGLRHRLGPHGRRSPSRSVTARLSSIIKNHSRLILAIFGGLTVLAAILASQVTIDGSVDQLLISGDPARELDRLAKEEFGNDEVLMVALDLGSPYTEADLRKLARLSDAIAEVPGVDRVKHLANTEDIRGSSDDLDASPLIELDHLTEQFEGIQARTRNHRLYQRLLVSPQQDVFGMLVYADNAEANSEAMNALTAAVVALIDATAPPWQAYYAGYPVTAFEVDRIVKRDLAFLTPIALLTISLILVWFARRLFPIVVLLVLIGWVEAVAHAWLAFWGISLNVVVSALPTILIATSATYVIYSVGLLARVSNDPDPGASLIQLLARPVVLSGLSTGIGFASLQFIDVEAIGDLGGALSIGMLAAMVGALLLVPALVQTFDLRIGSPRVQGMQNLALTGVRWARRPWRIIATVGLLVATALPGVLRMHVDTETLDYFTSDNFVRTGADFFGQNLSSAFLMNFVMRAEDEDRILEPDALAFAEEVVQTLEDLPQVDRTISILDYFYLMDAALQPDREPSSNPGSRAAAAQYLLLYEMSGDPEDYARYINFDRTALSIVVSAHGSSSGYIDAAQRVKALADKAPDGISVEPLGSVYLYARAMENLTRGMLVGLGVAVLLIWFVMAIGLRSVSLATLAAIPNLTPLLLCGGVLGWMNVPVSMGTSLVGCLALGLAVDDTAHVMGHLEPGTSLESVYRTVGPAVLLTTLALGVGFFTLVLSEFQTIRFFGIATAATLVIALVADILLLPSLLVLMGYPRADEVEVGTRHPQYARAA